MADQSDVETVLANLVGAVIYPQGINAPSILGSICRIYRGWPNAAALDADLAAGVVNITVFSEPRHQQNTTRWPDETFINQPATPTLTITTTLTADGATATIGGTAGPGQVAGILVDEVAVVHRGAAGDTPDLVAATLAGYLRTQRIAVLSGATVTIPGAYLVIGRVVADQTVLQEIRRQRRGFRITCWCPDPTTRDAAAAAIDVALAAQTFVSLPDGTFGRLRFVSSTELDQSEDASLFRRDLLYAVEYGTTQIIPTPSMIFGDAMFTANASGIVKNLLG